MLGGVWALVCAVHYAVLKMTVRQHRAHVKMLVREAQAGGVAFVLAALGEQLDAVLDVTVVYPQQKIPGFWDLISGAVP